MAALAQSSMGAALGVIFNAPFFGIVRNLGIDREEEKKKHSHARLVGKPVRIFIYCMGAAGGIAAFAGLGALFGGSAGLPRFDAKHTISWIQWALGLLRHRSSGDPGRPSAIDVSQRFRRNWAKCCKIIASHPAFWQGSASRHGNDSLPLTTFPGEHEMGELMSSWEEYSAKILILTALAKMLLRRIFVFR